MNRIISSKYIIIVVLIVGLFLRLVSLNQSLWLDEATSALVAKMSLIEIFTKFLPGDFHPPLYYLVLKYWVYLFGTSEISLRIPSVIFGVCSIYTTYLIAKKIFNKNIGLLSSAFLATSGLAIYYSQEARMYSMVAFLVTLSVYLFIEKKYLYFSIILAMIGLTDYVALFILPIFWYFGFKHKKFVLANIPLGLVFLTWLPIFLKQLLSGLSTQGSFPAWWGLLGLVTFKNVVLFPIKFVLGRISFDNNLIYGLIFIPIFGLFVYVLIKTIKESKILWLWMLAPIAIGMLVGFKIPTLSYFRFIFCLPPLYILMTKGVSVFKGNLPLYFSVVILLINIFSSGYYLLTPKFQREDWRRVSVEIGDDKIVLPADSQKEALLYYGKGIQAIYYKNFNGGEPEIWLSRYVWHIFDPQDLARKKIENLGYNKVFEANFNGVALDKYENRN